MNKHKSSMRSIPGKKVSVSSTQEMSKSITKQYAIKKRDENLARLKNIEVVQKMLIHLPIQYLFSKPNLKQHALERVLQRLLKLHRIKIKSTLKDVFLKWNNYILTRPPTAAAVTIHDHNDDFTFKSNLSSEKKFGIMVLAACLTDVAKKLLKRKFDHWAHLYCSKYNSHAAHELNLAAADIQNWYIKIKRTRNKEYQLWTNAVQVCMHRREAIKYIVKFEYVRRQALQKLRVGIACRRRYFFACRVIQRQYRWLLLYRKTKYRLIRVINVRKIQRWRRMLFYRTAFDKSMIKMVIRLGGYSNVFPKIPLQYMEDGMLKSFDNIASRLQRVWFKSCGKLALFEKFAARKREMAFQQMLNDNALIIQTGYRAHLWEKLLKAAYLNNRARRIQRGFRASMYRGWVFARVCLRRNRFARVISKFMKYYTRLLPHLNYRFAKRKHKIAEMIKLKLASAECIQRGYRVCVAKRLLRFKRELARFEKIRNNFGLVIATASMIQRNWRQLKPPYRFPRHVYLLMQRLMLIKRRALYKSVIKIQRCAKLYIEKSRAAQEDKRLKMVYYIYKLAKAYLLKLALHDLVQAKKAKRLAATIKLKRNLRTLFLVKALNIRFALKKMELDYEMLKDKCATTIQWGLHRKYSQHYMAVRVAGRKQLYKRRRKEAYDAWLANQNFNASIIIKCFRGFVVWNKNLRKIDVQRLWLQRHRAAKKIQKLGRCIIATQRYNDAIRIKYEKIEAERIKQLHIKASNTIGFYYRRYLELYALKERFSNRKKMLDEYKRLAAERAIAEEEKRLADEEVARTEENMRNTIAASWKQGSDTQGRNYYYNFITGESRWEPPEDWKMKPVDTWLRQKDERGNVYYYNQQTEESRWLPPCCICGDEGEKWCVECSTAYCEKDYEELHLDDDADEVMRTHNWSAVELDKDVLQPGDVYCLECKRRKATRMCTSCWDPYCDECYKYVHKSGALRLHKSIAYRRAKQGWMAVKARIEGEKDYYINGKTGETTYEKPTELMTADELKYYNDFKAHQQAAQEHVEKIAKLQFDLEKVSYQRDTMLFEQLKGATGGDKKKKTKGKETKMAAGEVIQNALKGGASGIMSMFNGKANDRQYRQNILKPDDRSRGKHRSDMIQSILEDAPDG